MRWGFHFTGISRQDNPPGLAWLNFCSQVIEAGKEGWGSDRAGEDRGVMNQCWGSGLGFGFYR